MPGVPSQYHQVRTSSYYVAIRSTAPPATLVHKEEWNKFE